MSASSQSGLQLSPISFVPGRSESLKLENDAEGDLTSVHESMFGRGDTVYSAYRHNTQYSESSGLETNKKDELDPTPTSDLLSAPASSRHSHLPTPQSPNNVMPYFPGVASSPESPLSYTPQRNLGGMFPPASIPQMLHSRSRSPLSLSRPSSSKLAQTVTPDSSPNAPTKRYIAMAPITPRTHSAPFRSPSPTHPVRIKPESQSPSLAPAHIISPPMSSYSVSNSPDISRSRSSSPFTTVLEQADEKSFIPVKSSDILRDKPATPQLNSTPQEPIDLFSPVETPERHNPSRSDTSTLSPLDAEKPATADFGRLPGGEIDRIRAHMLSLENSRALELETRRPEYLKRYKRIVENHDDPDVINDPLDKEGLGITDSPNKGRRLKLFDFKQTSAESFEESLMTHGYATYGESRTPQKRISAEDGLSQEAIEWLTHNTLAGPSTVTSALELGVEPSERELKKRKRLEAFRESAGARYGRLYPVEVEGKGRMILNVTADEIEEALVGSPTKKRTAGRKRKSTVDKKGKAITKGVGAGEVDEPKWLDKEFPWCLREKERDEAAKAQESERLQWIERFLDRDSDDDDDEDEGGNEEVLPSSTWGQIYDHPLSSSRKGRGKMVPLRANPILDEPQTTTVQTENVFFPSDPADARAALLSKKSVRSLAHRKRQHFQQRRNLGDSALNDDIVKCICGDGDDGTPQVQCDECHMWYHLDCIGIEDEKDLGDESDPWYCFKCSQESGRESSLEPSSPIHREPTFVPTDDRPLSSTRRDVAFYQSSPQASPLRDWSSSAPPQTPERGRDLSRDHYSGRSVWDDPSRPRPSTPYSSSRAVRVYTTPGGRFDEYGAEESSFDPTSTPSRGIKLGIPFVTPKSDWAARSSGSFMTPRNGGGGLNRNPFLPSAEETGSLGGHFRNIYSYDDTPIRRVSAADAPRAFVSHHLLDSPLASRSILTGFDESPILQSHGNERDEDERLLDLPGDD